MKVTKIIQKIFSRLFNVRVCREDGYQALLRDVTSFPLKNWDVTAKYIHESGSTDLHSNNTISKLADDESKNTFKQYIFRLRVLSPPIGSEYLACDMQELYESTELPHEKELLSIPPEEQNNQAAYGLNILPDFLKDAIIRITRDKISVDAGAYDGKSSIMLLENYFSSHVYAFEPVDYGLLLETSKNSTNITPVEGGTYSKDCDLSIMVPEDETRASTVNTKLSDRMVGDHRLVRMYSLDAFFQGLEYDIGCIKLDVEGAEFETILGAEKVIRKHRPVLLISAYHTAKDLYDIIPLIDSWNLDYNFYFRHTLPFDIRWANGCGLMIEYLIIAVPNQ
jgi:FkbM family methyltransferase